MKKFVLILALATSVAWGFEVAGIVGLNMQQWEDDNEHTASGTGVHGGILAGIGITPSCLPAYVGVESGFLLQTANYEGEDLLLPGDNMEIRLNNLIIPILLKGSLNPTSGLHIGAGLGPSIIVHNSGHYAYDWILHVEDDFNKDNLATDLGFQLKADVGIKLVPMLWLKPAIVYQLNANPDDPFTEDDDNGSESTLFISIGLAIKP